ncbi:MAG TPA: adenylate/guanylate cyclase domain-containing protein [Thermohalobaculum sp.]|nr:adenylate/guanylate cyclase domain-containing protein [Thermohalobaculum sp.]
MEKKASNRRLVAILAADVVGYSRLMGADDAGTLAALRHHRETLFNPAVEAHNGRVVKLIGDGTLVEFASVVDAVACALEIQRAVAEAAKSGDRAITLRIGVNLGDIIIDGNDIYGDGVNVAARLEALAEPGGVCVSSIVNESVGNRAGAAFTDAGEVSVKNIDRPIRVWKWHPDGIAPVPRPIPADVPLALPDRPSIAVLPFTNMSGDPEQEYFADGLTEDIITGLSRVRSLFVIARNSVFVYKGRAVSVAQVGQDLGVRYVLEGSLRKSSNRVRITAQLIEAATDHHVWAEKFDRELVEIFDLQDEITRNVVASTQTQIMLAEGGSTRRATPNDLDLWSLVNRSIARIHELTPESHADAKGLAQRALDIDPKCGPAWRCLSIVLYHEAHMLTASDYDATLVKALESAERSVALDRNDEYAHWNLGNVLVALRRYDRGISALQRAIEINPNYSTASGSLGTSLCYAGRAAEGIELNEIAIRSDPLNPSIFFRYSGLALGHYLMGDYAQAAEWARKSVQRNRAWYLGHVYLLAALAQLGRTEEAEAARQEYQTLFPRAVISDLARLPIKNPGDVEDLAAALRKAGLPE